VLAKDLSSERTENVPSLLLVEIQVVGF
jgi:hypothetical protein